MTYRFGEVRQSPGLPLQDDRGQVVLLPRAPGELDHPVVEMGDELVGCQGMRGADRLLKTGDAEALAGGVGPLGEAVGDQDDQGVAGTEGVEQRDVALVEEED